MYVLSKVNDCDMDGLKFDEPVDGAIIVTAGETGRWCWVLSAGPEYLKREGIEPFTYEEACEKIQEQGGEVDF